MKTLFALLALLAAPCPELVARWPLDVDAADAAGPHDGAALGSFDGASIALDGVDDHVEVPHAAALVPPSLTVAARVRVAAVPGRNEAQVVDKRGGSGFNLRIGGDAFPLYASFVLEDASGGVAAVAYGAVPQDTWVHLAGVLGGGVARIFANGVEAAQVATSIDLGSNPSPNALRIGASSWGGGPEYFLPGRVDDVRLYDRALTAAEIAELAAGGEPCATTTPAPPPPPPSVPRADDHDEGLIGDRCACGTIAGASGAWLSLPAALLLLLRRRAWLAALLLIGCDSPAPAPEIDRHQGLAAPYIDPRHLTALPFGSHSHWMQPWRAWQETRPAAHYLDGLGVGLDLGDQDDPHAVVGLLAKQGIRHVRFDLGWGHANFWDESKLNHEARWTSILRACRAHGVRPLITVWAHHGTPCPMNVFERQLAAPAKKGERRIRLNDVSDLKPGYSGLRNLGDFKAADPLITELKGDVAILSKPLPADLNGRVELCTLKYRPFSTPDEDAATMDGWTRFVGTVARFANAALGTSGGFDLEIWNELTFGSAFLSINTYYQPKVKEYPEHLVWGRIVAATAAYAEAHPADFRGVTLIDGFRNTVPWPASSTTPARVGALSAHPYPPRKRYPEDEPAGPALGPDFRETTLRPSYATLFPEHYATAVQTETLMRDAAPLTTEIYGTAHGRRARPGAPCPLWFTEMGLHPKEHGGVTDPAAALRLKAKTTARTALFFVHRGVDRVYFYSALGGDLGYGLIDDAAAGRLRRGAPAAPSPALNVLSRISRKMSERLDPALREGRPLALKDVADTHGHVQFGGEKPLFNREVFCFLPFQVNAKRFVAAYYVMSRDVLRDPPPEEYRLTIEGVTPRSVSAYDPLRDEEVKVDVLPGPGLRLNVRATDAPRLLVLEE